MQQDIMVSVIVLTYNHEKYIRKALDSILKQQVDFKYEVLVGDDCSTDSTREILMEYEQKYPDIFCLRLRNKNIGATKNAYELHMDAAGKYIANLDGDDYWIDSHKLAEQVAYLENNPRIIGCCHKCLIVDENSKLLPDYKINWIKYKKEFSIDDFDGLYLPGQISTYVRRNIYKNFDFSVLYTTHPMISDRIAMMIFLINGNFHCIDKYMSCYRVNHVTNISTLMYQNSHAAVWDDCAITYAMERYLFRNNKKKRFLKRKIILLLRAVKKMILYPNKKDFAQFKSYFLGKWKRRYF